LTSPGYAAGLLDDQYKRPPPESKPICDKNRSNAARSGVKATINTADRPVWGPAGHTHRAGPEAIVMLSVASEPVILARPSAW